MFPGPVALGASLLPEISIQPHMINGKTRRAHFCGIPDKGRGSFRPPSVRPAVRPPDIPDLRTRRILPRCWTAWNPMEFRIYGRREKLQRSRRRARKTDKNIGRKCRG